MNHHHKNRPPHIVKHPAYRRAFQRLDEALESASRRMNTAQALTAIERVNLVRRKLFGCVEVP